MNGLRYQQKRKTNQNPFFKHRQVKKRKSRAIRILLLVTGIILGCCFYLYHPVFRIQEVVVYGTHSIDPESVQHTMQTELQNFRVIPKNHIHFIPYKRLEAVLTSTYALDSVSIDKNRHTLIFTLQESITSIIITDNESFFLIDIQGNVVQQLEHVEQQDGLPQEYPVLNIQIGDSGPNIDPNHVQNIVAIHKALLERNMMPEAYTANQQQLDWVTVTIANAPNILFDMTGEVDIETQVRSLDTILAEYISAEEQVQYIDLRFGNRIFIR